MCHPPKQHSAKKSSLPVVEETNPVILPQDTTNEPFPPEQDDSPRRFSIHNNEYDSESDVEPQVTNPKTTGEDDSMVSAEDMPAEVAVPSLPSWMPHKNMSAAPSNDMLAAVIARVMVLRKLNPQFSLSQIDIAVKLVTIPRRSLWQMMRNQR